MAQLPLLDAGIQIDPDAERDPLDRYYSRPEYVAPLAAYLCEHAPKSMAGLVVEPCAGGCALISGLTQYSGFSNPWPRTVDIDPDSAAEWIGDWTQDPDTWSDRDALSHSTLQWAARDLASASLVLTDPPFSRAVAIVEASWRHCPRAVVAILQRSTWWDDVAGRGDWFAKHPPDMLCIGRCKFVRPNGGPILGKDGKPGGGDSTSYAWYVWGPDNRGPGGGIARMMPWKEYA